MPSTAFLFSFLVTRKTTTTTTHNQFLIFCPFLTHVYSNFIPLNNCEQCFPISSWWRKTQHPGDLVGRMTFSEWAHESLSYFPVCAGKFYSATGTRALQTRWKGKVEVIWLVTSKALPYLGMVWSVGCLTWTNAWPLGVGWHLAAFVLQWHITALLKYCLVEALTQLMEPNLI